MASTEFPAAIRKHADDDNDKLSGESVANCGPVSLHDAQQGISNVITYLEANIPKSTDLVQTLLTVLEYIKDHAKRGKDSSKSVDITSRGKTLNPLPETTVDSNTETCSLLESIDQVCSLPEKPEAFELVQLDDEFMSLIMDRQSLDDLCDENRALNTLPECLSIKRSAMHNTDMGVFTEICLQNNTCFGPYQGKIVNNPDANTGSRCFWQISTDDGEECYIDGQNPAEANWMRYVHCTSAEEYHNLQAFQHMDDIYYRATKDIKPGTELVVCYQYQQGDATDLENVQAVLDDNGDLLNADDDTGHDNDEDHSDDNSGILPESLYCDKCGLGFTKGLYDEHMTTEHKENTMIKCKAKQSAPPKHGKKRYQVHGVQKKSKKGSAEEQACFDVQTGTHKCPFCNKIFDLFSQFRYHYRKHTGEKPHQCEECGRCFRMKGHLKIHELTHTNAKPHSCPVCRREFSQMSNLKRHMRTHTGERPHQCNDCGKSFADSTTYKCHVRIHTGERPYKCDHCHKSFKTASARRAHAYSHSEPDRQCEQCDKTFKGKHQLEQHMKYHGVALRCPKCKDIFRGKAKLNDHIKNTCGIQLRCRICKEVFIGKYKLEEHMKLHFPKKSLSSA